MRFYKIIFIMTVQLAGLSNAVEAQPAMDNDHSILSTLNARFIKNFITQDTVAHNEIIHKDFVCINNDGSVIGRNEYMSGWSGAYERSGYTSFTFTDEHIRIFGNMALVRSKTVYIKKKDGRTVEGSSVYTDTYIKENGKWLCVQAQITPVAH
jgi:ketosteroid isomerase-like protein